MNRRRHPRHYKTALSLIYKYEGKVPLPIFLGQEFKRNRNWGSKDRKTYRELVYLYFKHFLYFQSISNELHEVDLQRLDEAEIETSIHPYTPLIEYISNEINTNTLSDWFYNVPPVFFLSWEASSHQALLSKNGTQIKTNVFKFDGTVDLIEEVNNGLGIIQDISSTELIQTYQEILKDNVIWDCCCGAGGKSLVLSSLKIAKQLYASDIRIQIIENLQQRFKTNRLQTPITQVIDLERITEFPWKKETDVDIIFADVPCTGSGTWRRNPERLAFFNVGEISKYAQTQRNILSNLVKTHPSKGIIYATCSLFKEENEANVAWFLETFTDYYLESAHYHGKWNETQLGDVLYSAYLKRK